jgi:hypothetical protein
VYTDILSIVTCSPKCQSYIYSSNGLSILTNDRIDLMGFTSFCPEDYSDEKCENKNCQIDANFDEKIISRSSLLFIHLTTAVNDTDHQHKILLKKIRFDENILTIDVTHNHLIFS